MKIIRIATLCYLALFAVLQDLQAGWLNRKAEGWFWYEDREKNLEEPEIEKPILVAPVSTPASIPQLTATEEMASIRKELEERLNRAMLEPSEKNVLAYMQMQQQWIAQSSQFSQTWVKNILNHPNLDSRLTDGPITQYGVQIQKQILREEKEERIRSLVNSHGLFFFYEGNSKISQAFSFVAKEFAKKYGWQIFSISCDGIFIAGFDHNQVDQGMTQRLGIEHFPSLYLIEPKKQVVFPIAFGLSSVDQIEENVVIQLNSSRSSQ